MAGVNVDRNRAQSPVRRQLPSLVCALALAGAGLSGCTNELDSWFDPSVLGRWEYTPTIVPVLERIDIIESDTGEYVETTEIISEDLIPEAIEYEIGPGDQLLIEIFDFLAPNVPSQLQRIVNGRGTVDLPQLGQIPVMGLTAKEVELRIVDELRNQGIIQDALVTVQALAQREATYSIFGAVPGVGRYIIPAPNFRLLDALTEAGGIPPTIPTVYVIRPVPLTDEVTMGTGIEPADRPNRPQGEGGSTEDGTNLEDLIERLTEPEGPGAPAAFSASLQSGAAQPARSQPDLIDLPQGENAPAPMNNEDLDQATGGQWVFLNGEWVRVAGVEGETQGGLGEGPDLLAESGDAGEALITQRVIEVPTKPLLQGNASYNIVVRPGDTVHVPSPEQGFVYVAGRGIARPGVYNLPVAGRLTLTKAVMAAGGLSQIGIASRTDLTRMVGNDRQATIRLNLKAIFEGTEPDVFLKPDDVVNVGTTWWAQPLAIARNGFRTTYGFGFLLDRNFGNDVFGPPPINRGF